MTISMRKPVEARAEAFIASANHSSSVTPANPEEATKTVVNIRVDSALLGRIDTDARRLGINRTAWLHVAANAMLGK